MEIEALEIIIIRLAFSSKLPTIEELIYSVREKKDDDLNVNIDNNEIGNEIKKNIRNISGSKLINK